MGRRLLVTWRGVRRLLIFGGFGVLMSVGGAWGIRHTHYANGYPAVSRWITSSAFVFETHGQAWWVNERSGLGRWRYEIKPTNVTKAEPSISAEKVEKLREDPDFHESLAEDLVLFGVYNTLPREERLANADPEKVVWARVYYGLSPDLTWSQPPAWVDSPDPNSGIRRTLTVAYGWPCPAMAEGVHNGNMPGVERVWLWTPGNREGRGLSRARPMVMSQEFGFPIRPVWWGLLANAAIFGGGLWMVVGSGRWAWRRLRYRRGMCRACGYDLAGLPEGAGCPECGEGKE